MDVGFTGTREGLAVQQREALRDALVGCGKGALHHGDCVGADAEAHAIARRLGFWIVRHPPINDRLRAFCDYDEDRQPEEYLARNYVIVQESERLIACPKEFEEQERGGTWRTVRNARDNGVLVIVVYPDGTLG